MAATTTTVQALLQELALQSATTRQTLNRELDQMDEAIAKVADLVGIDRKMLDITEETVEEGTSGKKSLFLRRAS